MGDKYKPRHSRNNTRFPHEEGLIPKYEPRKEKREKRNRNGHEWKREREAI